MTTGTRSHPTTPRALRRWATAVIQLMGCIVLASCSPSAQQTAQAPSPLAQSAEAAAAAQAQSQPQPTPAQSQTETPPRIRAVPGEWLVKFKNTATRITIQSALRNASFRPINNGYRSVPGLQRVKLADGADSIQARAALEQRDDVEYIEPNFILHEAAIPNDPKFADLWALKSPGTFGGQPGADIAAVAAWDITTGSSNVVIAVIDSGVDYNHQDLSANIFSNTADCNTNGIDDDADGYIDDCHGIDTANHDSNPMDDRGHGTHVAGTIGAVGNNGIGTVGVAWNVRILPCKFLDATGSGTTADAIECFDYIAMLRDRGVNIVASSNSWGGGPPSKALWDAVAAQHQHNILTVAAAGNDHWDAEQNPQPLCDAGAVNVLCVGASDYDDNIAYFSNWGNHVLAVQAPGVQIWSTYPGNQYMPLDGTSMATPHVSGVVALLAAQDPTRDWRKLKNLIITGADPYVGPYPKYNAPHLNALGSLTCTNRTVLKRLQPAGFETLLRPVGAKVVLSALHITCAAPAGAVNVTVAPSGEVVALKDDGLANDEVSGDGVYTGEWTVSGTGDYTLTLDGVPDDPVKVTVDRIKSGFPVPMLLQEYRASFFAGAGYAITVGNVTGDAHPEIFAPGLLQGPLYGVRYDGTALPGWPLWDPFTAAMPALGELDGDPTHEDLVATFETFSPIRRLTPTGATVSNWPQSAELILVPALADLDGDGRDEVITYPARYANGSLVSAPIALPPHASSISGVGLPAIADLDADGRPDIVTIDPTHVWAANTSGMLFGFPAFDTRAAGVSPAISPVIGDVDGDGEPEIVLATLPDWGASGRIQIYSNKGIYKRSIQLGSTLVMEPVLADLDGDGIPEILVAAMRALYAFKGDGTPVPGWPFTPPGLESILSYPVVGDLTGGGLPNVVVSTTTGTYLPEGDSGVPEGHLYVLKANGTVESGYPRTITIGSQAPVPAIADIDLDGRNELMIVWGRGYGIRDALFAYDFSSGPTGAVEWGQYRGGASHRGFYELGKNLPTQAYVTAHAHGGGAIRAAGGGIDCGVDCIERYTKGTSVVLTAAPGAGASFGQWLGDCAGQGNPCTVSVQRYTSVTARFNTPLVVSITGSGTGTVSSAPSGINCPADCSEVFVGDSVVKLSATAAPGSDFDGWSGGCTGTDPVCSVLIDAAKTVTAKFVTSRRLTLSKDGNGSGTILSAPTGIDCGSTCLADFLPDSSVTLSAAASPGSYFVKWAGACSASFSGVCTVTMDAERSAVATFAVSPVLTVQRTGTGSGVITSDPAGIDCGTRCTMSAARPNDLIRLQARADADSEFVSFSGGCFANSGDCVVNMDRDQTVNANFVFRPMLSIQMGGVGGKGRVTSSVGGVDCDGANATCQTRFDGNTQVVLTAVANSGGRFDGWSGACSGTASTCAVTMNARKTVIATFSDASSPPPNNGGGGGGGRFDLLSLLALALVGMWRVLRPRWIESSSAV